MGIMVKPNKGKAAVVPNGTYDSELTAVKQFQNVYGDRIGFEFTLEGEDVAGLTVMRSTSHNLSKQSKLAELVKALLGRNLTETELSRGMDIEALVGTKCKVLVLQSTGKGGQVYSNVEQVFK